MAARLFLFHGADALASGNEVRRWQTLFYQKYGDATRYLIDLEELGAAEAVKEVVSAVETASLFLVPKLILLRRTSSKDQGARSSTGGSIVAALKEIEGHFDETVTFAIWEEKQLAATHPLMMYFTELQAAGKAKVSEFSVPNERGLAKAAEVLSAAFGKSLAPDALAVLRAGYKVVEGRQRQVKRTKAGQELSEDERGWWLKQTVETACLLASSDTVMKSDLETSMGFLVEPVSPFDIADALASASWQRARSLLCRFASSSEDGDFFSLLAALRWKMGRPGMRANGPLALRLLAESEVVMKNYPVPLDVLFTLFIDRLERGEPWVLPPRTLWLANLART